MPYSGPNDPDLPANVRTLPEGERARWVAVWNDAYRACRERGGKDCEGAAFRTANGALKRSANQPDAGDVHMPQPVKVKRDRDAKPTRYFLARLRDLLKEYVGKGEMTDQDYAAAVRKARAHAGGMMRARRRSEMAAHCGMPHAGERQAAEDDGEHTGLIVALWVPAPQADLLAVAGGEPAADLHLTLAYLGESTPDLAAKVHTAVGRFCERRGPVTATVSGIGRFAAPAGEDDAYEAVYASVDCPYLGRLREELIDCLMACGLPVSMDHGFTPHITLAYVPAGEPSPIDQVEPMEMRFTTVCVAAGEDRTEFALAGPDPHAANGGLYPGMMPAAYREVHDLVARREGQTHRLFLEARFGEAPEWIPVLPAPGTYAHPRYGEIVITRARNERFVQQFNGGVYQSQVPVDAEHETKLSGACGWITELRLNADGSADARVEWTDRGIALMEGGRFKYVSPEWYDEWTDPATRQVHRDVLIGAALTTRPFFKEGALRSLVASERGLEWPDEAAGTDGRGDQEESRMAEQQVAMTEEQARRFAEMERQLTEAQAQAKQLAERLASQERAARTKRFTDEVLGRSDENGHAWTVGEVKAHVTFMEKLALAFGEQSEELAYYIATMRSATEQARQGKLFAEVGTDATRPAGEDAVARARGLAAKRAAEERISLGDALGLVFQEDPALYAAYTAQTTQTL
jgi:2'-5' RNA ligase